MNTPHKNIDDGIKALAQVACDQAMKTGLTPDSFLSFLQAVKGMRGTSSESPLAGYVPHQGTSVETKTPASLPAGEEKKHLGPLKPVFEKNWLYQVAIDCPHDIETERVILFADEKSREGYPSDQLRIRLSEFALRRFGIVDEGLFHRAALDVRHEIGQDAVTVYRDENLEGNALNQLSQRLARCALDNFKIEDGD